MRIVPVLTAIVVTATLYLLIMERETLMAFALGQDEVSAEDTTAIPAKDSAEMQAVAQNLVRVVVQSSESEEIDSAVQLRGETEAAREVQVMAETTAVVISDPLRRGSFVEAGQEMCRLDPGTRHGNRRPARPSARQSRDPVCRRAGRLPQDTGNHRKPGASGPAPRPLRR